MLFFYVEASFLRHYIQAVTDTCLVLCVPVAKLFDVFHLMQRLLECQRL
jgi:hypothetical protein